MGNTNQKTELQSKPKEGLNESIVIQQKTMKNCDLEIQDKNDGVIKSANNKKKNLSKKILSKGSFFVVENKKLDKLEIENILKAFKEHPLFSCLKTEEL